LNAKPREEREKKEEKTPVQEETPAVEAPKEEEATPEVEVKAEETENFERRKKKKFEDAPVNKEDLLVRPENALNYAEYMQQLKEKNQNLKTAAKKVAEVENSDLKPQVKDSDLTIGITTGAKKQQKVKPKDKKDESLSVNFQTGDDYERSYDNRENKNFGGKKKGPKFNFKSEDFPEL
jgi:hypothetical protein